MFYCMYKYIYTKRKFLSIRKVSHLYIPFNFSINIFPHKTLQEILVFMNPSTSSTPVISENFIGINTVFMVFLMSYMTGPV